MPVGLESLEGYSWIVGHVPKLVESRLEDLRGRLQPILDNNILPHFTDHSLNHSDRIVGILGALLATHLAEKGKNPLNEHELTILLFGALLHDLAMQLPKAHGIETEVGSLTGDELRQIRENHGTVSGKVVREIAEGDDDFNLGLGDERYRKYLPHIATLCEKHQSSATYNPEEATSLSGKKIRVGLLIALLRIADQLDCDCNRVFIDRLQHFSIPLQSIVHWLMCHYVDSVTVEDGRIEILASHPEDMSGPAMELLSAMVLKKIASELELAGDTLWKNNVKLKAPREVKTTGADFTYQKRRLPNEIITVLLKDKQEGPPVHVVPVYSSVRMGDDDAEKGTDFMSYWGLVGNPFLDEAVSYGDELFVETPQIAKLVSETTRILAGKYGDSRLVIGPRGMGKTTLFESIRARLGDRCPVHIIDVADKVVDVRSATDLHQLILQSISRSVQPDSDPLDIDAWAGTVRSSGKKVICLDSLDRLPYEKAGYIRDFLQTAQKVITDLRHSSLVLISCADRWEDFLFTSELSYLGESNKWVLEPFSTEKMVAMLDRRLKTSGRSYSAIFDEGTAAALHALSGGNPRKALEHARAICRLAALRGKTRVTSEFIRMNYKGEFEKSFVQVIETLSKASDRFVKGLTSLYLFYLEMERRNLDTHQGWRYLLETSRGSLFQSRVSPAFYGPMLCVASLGRETGETENKYRVLEPVSEVFQKLEKRGYKTPDFLAFYSANPVRPAGEDDASLLSAKNVLVSGEDLAFFERARQRYLELKRDKTTATRTLGDAWECIESLMVAVLIKRAGYSPQKFLSSQEAAFSTDVHGSRRYKKGAGRIRAAAAGKLFAEFTQFLRSRKLWLDSYNDVQWILATRGNLVRGGPAHMLHFGERERELCLGHLDNAFRDLVRIYG